MYPFKITLKNYRCFEDSRPLSLEIGPGFTALVGPNNSGKSTFVRFFFEMRNLFENMTRPSEVVNWIKQSRFSVQPLGTEDPIEIYHNQNARPVTIEFEFPRLSETQISRVRFRSVDRNQSDLWDRDMYCGSTFEKIVLDRTEGPGERLATERGTPVEVDASVCSEVFGALARALYIGPFRNAITEGEGLYYDLSIGTSFIASWDGWKTGPSRRPNQVVQQVELDIAHIFDYNRLEINATSDNRTLQVIVNQNPYRLRELGAGVAQFIIVLGNVAIRNPPLILIDEPELNLHPSLQADFLTSLVSYSAQGNVIFATHSLGLARTLGNRVYTFQREGTHSIARPFEQTPNFAEFVGEMSFSSFKELGYNTILLVEGIHDVKAVQQFLRALDKDHKIVVLPLGGSQFITSGRQIELNELTRLGASIGVLIDSERSRPGDQLSQDRAAFVQDCRSLGFNVHATDFRAFENYLTQQAIQAVLGVTYQALGPFQVLSAGSPSWGKQDNWRIARAMTKPEIMASDVGQFLDRLS